LTFEFSTKQNFGNELKLFSGYKIAYNNPQVEVSWV